jgi:hypothetical protein
MSSRLLEHLFAGFGVYRIRSEIQGEQICSPVYSNVATHWLLVFPKHWGSSTGSLESGDSREAEGRVVLSPAGKAQDVYQGKLLPF